LDASNVYIHVVRIHYACIYHVLKHICYFPREELVVSIQHVCIYQTFAERGVESIVRKL